MSHYLKRCRRAHRKRDDDPLKALKAADPSCHPAQSRSHRHDAWSDWIPAFKRPLPFKNYSIVHRTTLPDRFGILFQNSEKTDALHNKKSTSNHLLKTKVEALHLTVTATKMAHVLLYKSCTIGSVLLIWNWVLCWLRRSSFYVLYMQQFKVVLINNNEIREKQQALQLKWRCSGV